MARRAYYKMTARRRVALKKAQAASARKRRRNKLAKTAAVSGGIAAGITATALTGYKASTTVKKYQRAKRYSTHRAGLLKRQAAHKAAHRQFVGNALFGQQLSLPQKGSKPAVDVTTFGKRRVGGGVIKDKSGRDRGNPNGLASPPGAGQAKMADPLRGGWYAAAPGSPNVTRSVKRLRGLYNNDRRWGYDSKERHVKYINVDKPRRQAKRRSKR